MWTFLNLWFCHSIPRKNLERFSTVRLMEWTHINSASWHIGFVRISVLDLDVPMFLKCTAQGLLWLEMFRLAGALHQTNALCSSICTVYFTCHPWWRYAQEKRGVLGIWKKDEKGWTRRTNQVVTCCCVLLHVADRKSVQAIHGTGWMHGVPSRISELLLKSSDGQLLSSLVKFDELQELRKGQCWQSWQFTTYPYTYPKPGFWMTWLQDFSFHPRSTSLDSKAAHLIVFRSFVMATPNTDWVWHSGSDAGNQATFLILLNCNLRNASLLQLVAVDSSSSFPRSYNKILVEILPNITMIYLKSKQLWDKMKSLLRVETVNGTSC